LGDFGDQVLHEGAAVVLGGQAAKEAGNIVAHQSII
jgi:hypothetical protein